MKPGKHLAGVALFFFIFASTVIITNFLTAPISTIPPVKIGVASPGDIVDATSQPFNYRVRMVSLDFITGKSYTTLVLRRETGQPAPEKLWVRTVFFTPDGDAYKTRSSLVGIRQPFSRGERVEITVTGECAWCADSNSPKAGYFARVYVSTGDAGDFNAPAEPTNRKIKDAIPVVVQNERERYR